MEDYLLKAIRKLKPTAQFSFSAEDYATIKWDVLEGVAPSQAEINKAIEQIKADEINQAKIQATAKAELLARLGITEAEAKLLLAQS